MAEQEHPPLKALGGPRKINLAEEMELAGVVVPQDVADAIPENQPVLLPYQQRWFEDESQIMIAEKSRRTGLTWAEAYTQRGQSGKTAQAPRLQYLLCRQQKGNGAGVHRRRCVVCQSLQ
ncbi:hypothetical protein [Paludibacterium denitrificans]|uniref:hypothetical protein n=1 Tax=Paludibacterium denitrificans TaxID=2675226 RepID=UPI001E3B9E34|nr:hypothetical protein [Paludibacterium denitrificans]